MSKKVKSIICSILAIVMMSSLFAVSASAASNEVDVLFYAPSSWGSNIKIHLWNAGSLNTQWPGTAMTNNGNGTYSFKTTAIGSCNFVINNGNGQQTSDLYAEGKVGVKDNKTFERSAERISINFKKPANWGSNVKMYYYSNDNNEVSLTAWPGTAMTFQSGDLYTGYIYDMANVRVIFTDGVNQYPAQNQPGAAVKAGQIMYCQDNKYTTENYEWIKVIQPTQYAIAKQDYHIKVQLSYGNDTSLLQFVDQYGTTQIPKSIEKTVNNGVITYDCTFNFQWGNDYKELTALYYYHSGMLNTGKTAKFNVINGLSTPNQCVMDSTKYSMNVGDTFEVVYPYSSNVVRYSFDTPNGPLYESSFYYTYEGSVTYRHSVLVANKIGRNQIIQAREDYIGGGSRGMDRFVTVDVWA